MKNVPVILVVCMLLFSSLDVLAQGNNAVNPAECCFKYYTDRLPKYNVVSCQRTDLRCAKDGVIFTMKNARKICADPTQKWVQDVISHLGKGGHNPCHTALGQAEIQ